MGKTPLIVAAIALLVAAACLAAGLTPVAIGALVVMLLAAVMTRGWYPWERR